MQKFSYLKSVNAEYIDEQLARYLQSPESVDPSWRYFFEGLELSNELCGTAEAEHSNGHAANGHAAVSQAPTQASSLDLSAEAKVADLITAYREYGKLIANIDPLTAPPTTHSFLELGHFGLSDADLGKTFQAGKLIGIGASKLSDIIAKLRATYCRTLAVEITHISDPAVQEWLQKRIESVSGRDALDTETRKQILRRLSDAETFERFLHTRYVAQKRFSVEGGEAVIPALDCMIEVSAELGAKEIVLGMAHRGRLNVLTHIFGKKPEYIFTEFEGTYKLDPTHGEGDVKYHKGYSADIKTRKGKPVHLSLASNPSHLEVINPVVEGVARAKQARLEDKDRTAVVPVLIHGDAAFAGQGVCYETINLSQLEGYKTGGTLHIVINNQVGFTADSDETRSTRYCTDLAKMLDAPVFHVNGDDPEAVWFASQVCTEYRQKFHADAFIDLICYRKYGHNEGDEPAFTQPLMYKKIKSHPSPREAYAAELARAGVVSEAESNAIVEEITARLTAAQAVTKKEAPYKGASVFEGAWKGLKQPGSEQDLFKPVKTQVADAKLREIAEKINTVPPGFHLHPKLTRFFEARLKAVRDGKGIDWGNGEALAYATLISEGHPVRLSGQDVERGTFTHRQSMLHDFETGEEYSPINAVATGKARYDVHNSHLSETGVMGFEYGYSLASPESLVIWEAQFGDFGNGAQIIIDQFLSSSESKWQRMSGLTLLLPHGYEGQGPEHSSARLERFLQLAGKNNIFVCNLTTPAQIFHALRRQVILEFRKPLVVMSPKSLLRNPHAVSSIEEFTKSGFQEAIDDPTQSDAKSAKGVKRVLLCTGKVYYDLAAEAIARKRNDVAVIRVEQLYPWPADLLKTILARYSSAKEFVWVQEEPRNMGAWQYVFGVWMGGLAHFGKEVGGTSIGYAGRDIGAAPAVGSPKVHETEQKALIEQAFT